MHKSHGAALAPALGRSRTTLVSGRRAELRPLPVLVRCSGAPAHPNPLPLLGQPQVLGAGSEANMVSEADTASRRHAELAAVPEGVLVSDLGSKNDFFTSVAPCHDGTGGLASVQPGAIEIGQDVFADEMMGGQAALLAALFAKHEPGGGILFLEIAHAHAHQGAARTKP